MIWFSDLALGLVALSTLPFAKANLELQQIDYFYDSDRVCSTTPAIIIASAVQECKEDLATCTESAVELENGETEHRSLRFSCLGKKANMSRFVPGVNYLVRVAYPPNPDAGSLCQGKPISVHSVRADGVCRWSGHIYFKAECTTGGARYYECSDPACSNCQVADEKGCQDHASAGSRLVACSAELAYDENDTEDDDDDDDEGKRRERHRSSYDASSAYSLSKIPFGSYAVAAAAVYVGLLLLRR